MKKLSNIHKRLLGLGGKAPALGNPHNKPTSVFGMQVGGTRPRARESEIVKVAAKPGFYIACMGEDDAITTNHEDAAVISIRSPGASRLEFPNAVATLHLESEVHENSRDDTVAMIEKTKEFLLKSLPNIRRLHVHCTYGEIRSYSMVIGMSGALSSRTDAVNIYRYTGLRGFLTIPDHELAPNQSMSNVGFRAMRAAILENKEILNHIS